MRRAIIDRQTTETQITLTLALDGCLVGPSFNRPAPPDVAAYLPPESPAVTIPGINPWMPVAFLELGIAARTSLPTMLCTTGWSMHITAKP